MKIVIWLMSFVMSLLVGVYVLLFTSFGNGIVAPFLEKEIVANTHLASELKKFHLSSSDLDVELLLNEGNAISLQGEFSLMEQSFHISYDVVLNNLESLASLTQTKLQGSFTTQGDVVGDLKLLNIDGKSNIASSSTTYHVTLEDFNPTSIVAKMKNVHLDELLYTINEKEYANAIINLDANFKNVTPHHLDGIVTLQTLHGKLNRAVLKKDFDITIPKTAFSMDLSAILKDDTITYKYLFDSNLAKVFTSGNVVPEPLRLKIKYGVDLKELALLKPLSGVDMQGPLALHGEVQGTKESLLISGKSTIAASKSSFSAELVDFKPKNFILDVKKLQLQKVLYMVKQPHYTDGYLDLNVRMTNADVENLEGSISSKIYKGVLDSTLLSKEFNLTSPMPKTTYTLKTESRLHKELLSTKVVLNSKLLNLKTEKSNFNIDTAAFSSDYKVDIEDLNRLFFVTQQHLKGSLEAKGTISQAKDLDFTMVSHIADGSIDVKLHNERLNAKLEHMKTLSLLEMLLYPKVFDAYIDGNVKYNLSEAKGVFEGDLTQGKFTQNKVLDLTKEYAHINLYKEVFKGDVHADIKKENIVASLDLRSNKSSVTSKNLEFNTTTQKIDAKVEVSANGNPLTFYVKGDINGPKVKVNANKLLKKEATKAVEKGLKNYFKGLF